MGEGIKVATLSEVPPGTCRQGGRRRPSSWPSSTWAERFMRSMGPAPIRVVLLGRASWSSGARWIRAQASTAPSVNRSSVDSQMTGLGSRTIATQLEMCEVGPQELSKGRCIAQLSLSLPPCDRSFDFAKRGNNTLHLGREPTVQGGDHGAVRRAASPRRRALHPAQDPYMGAMLLNHLSRPNVRRHGVEIQGEAVVQGEHTLYLRLVTRMACATSCSHSQWQVPWTSTRPRPARPGGR